MSKTTKSKEAKSRKSRGFLAHLTLACWLICFLLAGCDSLRFAPSETQKQNAWLHNRTAVISRYCKDGGGFGETAGTCEVITAAKQGLYLLLRSAEGTARSRHC